jgi:hypothetical protein
MKMSFQEERSIEFDVRRTDAARMIQRKQLNHRAASGRCAGRRPRGSEGRTLSVWRRQGRRTILALEARNLMIVECVN